MTAVPQHTLSFDVEEWFQVANHAHACPREGWDALESRVEPCMGRILDLLRRREARTTFFFLGWIAERHPDLVRRVIDGGHEVASHGYDHRFLQEARSSGTARGPGEDRRGPGRCWRSQAARVPGSTFTLTRRTWWAFDVLVERGYRYDSSVHPIGTRTMASPGSSRGSPPSRPRREPSSSSRSRPTHSSDGTGPGGGRGYFRLLPGGIHRALFASLERMGRPTATYLHPWEVDPSQPRVEAR